MAYSRTVLFKIGETGLTLKAALFSNADAIHATFRDVAIPEKPAGSGMYRLASDVWPSGYVGEVVAYTGTLGVSTTFAGVTVRDASAVNPGDYEVPLSFSGEVSYSGPTESVIGHDGNDTFAVRLVAGDSYEDGNRLIVFTFAGYTGPNLNATAGQFRMSSVVAYEAAAPTADAPAELVSDATISQTGTTVTFTAPLTAAQTDVLDVPKRDQGVYPTHKWQAVAMYAGTKPITIKIGNAYVTRRIEATPTPDE